jgi:hypothetical protein
LIEASTFDWDISPQIRVPFPFIAACLVLGASFDVKQGYSETVSLEPFNKDFDDGDINDGITVIDITDLSHVRYCFVLWDGCDPFLRKGVVNVPTMTPLSGPLYLRAYYKDLQELIVPDLEGWDIISTYALLSAWPEGDWQDSLNHKEHIFGKCKNIACPLPALWQTARMLTL